MGVVNRRCSHDGCLKSPSYRLTGSRNAEFCQQHAEDGMADVRSNSCSCEACSTRASYGLKATRKQKFCLQHTEAGMVNLKRDKSVPRGRRSEKPTIRSKVNLKVVSRDPEEHGGGSSVLVGGRKRNSEISMPSKGGKANNSRDNCIGK